MGRRYWSSLKNDMGLLAIIFTVLSLIFRDVIQLRFLHLLVCVLIPMHLFGFLTFELRLFSRNVWIRRTIVIFFDAIVLLAVNFAFGYLRPKLSSFILWGATILIFIVLSVFAYYVEDKIEKQNLKAINQKLADELTKNTK